MHNRIHWLDAARAIAILLVVFTHCHEQAGIYDPLRASVFYTIDRLGVPIFFMISGGLIFDKVKDVDILSFYRKRVVQFLVLLVVYSVLTNTVKFILETGAVYSAFVNSLVGFNGVLNTTDKLGPYGGARQLWFMYAIIQLYLIAPFVSKMLDKAPTKNIIIFAVFCVLLNQVRLTLTTFGFGWTFLDMISNDFVGREFSGADFTGAYLLYFLIGYLIISRGILNNLNKVVLGSIAIALLVVPSWILIKADISVGKLILPMHWYNSSLFILLSSVGLFILIKVLFENKRVWIFELLSLCSFGIYLSHYAFIYIFKHIQSVYMPSMDDIGRMNFYFLASFTFSLFLVVFMMRVKALRYFVR
ncbi:acyltransferase [Scandinavium sp. NPDC088450]|uniref:acyltransferase n=1 Tax=Scandinavium sp. NPDC088450 TaxID=3364514 RepID=UPI00384DFC05